MTDIKKENIRYITIPTAELTPEMLAQLQGQSGGVVHAQDKDASFGANLIRSGEINPHRVMKNFFRVECVDKYGNIKWLEEFSNLVVDVGLDDSLDKHLKGSTYTAAWFVGLSDSSPTIAAGDTMASHVGWVDDVNYSNGTRPTLTLGSVSSQSVDNSGSVAAFTIDGTTTFGGAFITDNNTKGQATGILYGVGAFTGGDRAVVSGDTVNVTVTLTAAAS